MNRIHLRCDSDKRPGETKDWIISDTGNGLRIEWGATGKKLSTKMVGVAAFKAATAGEEMQRRIYAQLREGYYHVTGTNPSTPATAANAADTLYVQVKPTQAMLDLIAVGGSSGISGAAFDSWPRIEGKTINLRAGRATRWETREGERGAILGSILVEAAERHADAGTATISSDTGQLFNTSGYLARLQSLPEDLLELAYRLKVRARPMEFAPVQDRTGQSVTPVLF